MTAILHPIEALNTEIESKSVGDEFKTVRRAYCAKKTQAEACTIYSNIEGMA
jgi:hypothetical protein